MSTEYSDQFIPYDALVARCEAKGIDVENNALVATRMPPGLACAMSPEGYTNAQQLTGKNSAFVRDLGEPAPNLRSAWADAAPRKSGVLTVSSPKPGSNA